MCVEAEIEIAQREPDKLDNRAKESTASSIWLEKAARSIVDNKAVSRA